MRLFSFRPERKYRVFSLMGALALGFLSVFLTLSMVASLLNLPVLPSWLGDFFIAAYGILAFMIPAYLCCAALLLIDRAYRPDRIFILSCTTFPFLTLSIGFGIIRDFEFQAERFPLLAWLGKVGFGFCTVILTVAEGILIIALASLLFPQPEGRKLGGAGKMQKKPQEGAPPKKEAEEEGPILLLPAPDFSFEKLNVPGPVFAENRDKNAGNSPEKDKGLHLPELKPLAVAAALEALEETMEKQDQGEDEEGFIYFSAGGKGGHNEPADNDEDEPDTAYENEAEDAGEAHTGLDGDLERALSEAEEYAAARKEIRGTAGGQHIKPAILPRKKTWGSYRVPVEGILNQYPDGQYWIIDQGTRDAAVILKETLREFNIQAEVTGIRKGPVITMFEILPAPGVKLSKIVNLQDNIALRLAASSVRIVAPIPGKHAVGIEVPNAKRNIVSFREIIEGELQREGKKLEIPVVLGKDITGEAQTVDLVQTPHLLIAGSTGSGKSVCVNSMILSILYQLAPAECRLILIDPKIVELKLYNDIPHLLTPVITEPKRAFQALQYCIYEMERRYACLDSMGVRDIRSYNRRIKERNIAAEHMPYIVVVIDEFADLMVTTGKELESTVARLAAMSRAVGIHLVLATQRPSIDVITGLIKANIPSRIAFMVASKMDSRIIIDMVGAEKLLGKGDMLYAGAVDPFPIRMQGAFISEEEVERVVEYVKALGAPDYIDDEIFFDDEEEASPSLFSEGEDPLYDKALEVVMQQGKASASYIQRRLKIGYNRAARLVEEMEHRGVVGP
ncbi:MAG: DNA translocase FtsK, partial [Treponema sp.]|nr:DNA translocase FtsK [Treponema sp.]